MNNLDTQIASTPAVLAKILGDIEAPRLDPERPIIFTGIGTSLHAARVAANWITTLSGGVVRPLAIDAHDMGTTAPLRSADQLIVISHRGNKIFPLATLERARKVGAATVSIVGQTAPRQPADHTLRTCASETAGTFTVSYLSSLAVLAKIAAQFDRSAEQAFAGGIDQLPDAVARTLALGDPARAAQVLAGAETLLVVGFEQDLPTAQEAALKIKEGAWMWTEAMSPEFALHGTPAGFWPGMAAVVIEPGRSDGGRTDLLLTALERLGNTALSVVEDGHGDLAFTSPHPLLRPVTGMVPLQLLTAELARIRDTDPDTMHGHREPWKTVMTELIQL
ncbi:MAG: SIS domain-containing protein [Dehalococcoidia bacterium]|uniref:SIS domain-containing protein n=1 Tax=Pseudonocardia sp. TaxID=60912 RepID=UPI003D144926